MPYYNRAPEMVNDTRGICETYGLVANSRRGKNDMGEEMYTIDGVLGNVVDGMDIKVQIQLPLEQGRWRYLFMWKSDPSSNGYDGYMHRFQRADWENSFEYFEDLGELVDDIYDFVPEAIDAYYAGQAPAGNPADYNDGTQDVDD